MFADDDYGAADGDEDLTHDDVADVLVWLAEMDHETLCEDVEWYGKVEEPFKVAGLADEETDAEEESAGEDVEGRADVSCFCDGEIGDYLEEGGEVGVPAVV